MPSQRPTDVPPPRSSSASELSTSPTPTLRTSANIGALPAPSMSQMYNQRGRQDLGVGQPSLTPTPLSRTHSPGRYSEYSTDDDIETEYESQPPSRAQSRPPFTSDPRIVSMEQTPRGSQRGPPVTAYGSTFGSPSISQGGSVPRPPRLPRNNSTSGHPVTHPVAPSSTSHPYGSTIRSASRARPGLPQNASTNQLHDDDEEFVDRGADLIRRRQVERKQARRKKEREKRGEAEGDEAPRTLGPAAGRSVSRSRIPSSTRRQTTDGQTSYAGSVHDDTLSPRTAFQPPSVYSSDGEEEREREQDIIDDVVADVVEAAEDEEVEEEEEEEEVDDEGVTLRDRQDAINIEHPFGLPIWKPALYRKSRSITRNAESALHSIPSAAAERHLLPGNLLWVAIFGWWLAVVFLIVAILVSAAEVLGGGRGGYGKTLRGLAWYIGWPFGKYVEGEGAPDSEEETTEGSARASESASEVSDTTPRAEDFDRERERDRRQATVSFANDESTPLLKKGFRRPRNKRAKILGRIVYWPLFFFILAPVLLAVCTLCWGLVITIPMAKLVWALLGLLWNRPLEINFRPAPKVVIPLIIDTGGQSSRSVSSSTAVNPETPSLLYRRTHLQAGQIAPTSGPTSTVLLCVYRAVGLEYYKYTVGGVNIIFINLLPLVFFTLFDNFVILPQVERAEHRGENVSPFLAFIASQWLIFILAMSSVIPLSYFIGMAVASISAQSSIGMGAVINATFGSIIEIILYAIALTQGKGRLVEGSIVGSILAGVLLMPGMSMCSGALKRKEQKFNAKSAGVTSTMLIMAIIGTLTPTMFYQIYGSFELHCDNCPTIEIPSETGFDFKHDGWKCTQCFYEHPDPVNDPFYQEQVKTLMYACAVVLLLSYLIGLWFSLRTHASQIWQNPQQLMKSEDVVHPAMKTTLSQRMTPAMLQQVLPLHRERDRSKEGTNRLSGLSGLSGPSSPSGVFGSIRSPKFGTLPKLPEERESNGGSSGVSGIYEPNEPHRSTSASYNLPPGFTPYLESVPPLGSIPGPGTNHSDGTTRELRLPNALTTEDFTRAVAVATVSALRHQRSFANTHAHNSPARVGGAGGTVKGQTQGQGQAHGGGQKDENKEDEEDSHGGHEGPSWTRGVSAGVLLGCTLLYALIAETLVDVVDVVLQGAKIDEKFLGLTLFTLVPNTTEFMNAVSFAMQGNIALSMEIGSAYALQVCLLQIPAMVAFSAFYDPGKMGEVVDTFTLIFPRWDVISIILAIFLLTYTYIEARSNYHRGSVLVLAYVVLIMGFWYAPVKPATDGNAFGGAGMGVFSGGVGVGAGAGGRVQGRGEVGKWVKVWWSWIAG